LNSALLEESAEAGGEVKWDAYYTFSASKRKVHNVVTSTFTLKDGLIWKQRDTFDLWKWSRQALGTTGVLLGWSPIVRNKVQGMAAKRLAKAMVDNELDSLTGAQCSELACSFSWSSRIFWIRGMSFL
jgi:hypothetical protein